MRCPRCVQRIHRAAGGCPHCGFTLADADKVFGAEDLHLRTLSDSAGLMRRDEQGRLQAVMQRFNRRFPQLFVAVHTRSFGGLANLRQFGFWFLNRTKFEDSPSDLGNRSAILLVMDADSKSAGISFGYALDAFLDEEDTFQCLARAHAYWLEGRHADGLVKAIEQLIIILKKRSRQVRRDPARFERKVSRPAQIDALAQKIQGGRRAKNSDRSGSGEEIP
jgi:hypothetical protein